MPDYDPRLVALYDIDNPDGPDHDYYRALADRIGARRIVDLGCGTGILTVTLCAPGREVVGIDPSANMIAYAAARTGAGGVRWLIGDSRQIPQGPFDYVVMSGNVAQHIPDPAWAETLSAIAHALRPGGVLAFESRNPAARAWQGWGEAEPTVRLTAHGELREWMEIAELGAGQVLLTAHNVLVATAEDIVMEELLSFRESDLLRDQLAQAGLVVDAVWGGWERSGVSELSPLLVFEARRA